MPPPRRHQEQARPVPVIDYENDRYENDRYDRQSIRPPLAVPEDFQEIDERYGPSLRRARRRRTPSPVLVDRNEQSDSGRLEEPADSTFQLFKYSSLESVSRPGPRIRLLKIFPSTSKKTYYKLAIFYFDNLPPYKAISYAWGDPANSRYVSIKSNHEGDGWLKVPLSLHAALEALRDETEGVLVWADSVCIDQQSNREKSQQLSRIPQIYGKAEQVVVWLGVEMDDSEHAQTLLRDVAHGEAQLNSDLDLRAIVSLFDREYWSRLWVVQEILHASDIVVRCGRLWLDWDDYEQASRLFQSEKMSLAKISTLVGWRSDSTRLITSQHRLSPLQILLYHGPASILHMEKARDLYADDPFFYLLHVLRLGRTKLASDPKDRVYGILGILPENVRERLKVDYQLPVKQIYIDIVDILLRSGKMDVLCESIHFPPLISNANLPSWVPDWSYDPMMQSLASLPLSFSAGTREPPSFRFYEEHLAPPTRSKLLIAGVRIGRIDVHGMAVNTHSRAADYCMAFLQWRVLLLQRFGIVCGTADDDGESRRRRVASCEHQRRFCLTLSLGQPLRTGPDAAATELVDKKEEWTRKCYSVFAKSIKSRLPMLPIDEDLEAFAEMSNDMEPEAARQFLQDSFAEYMMGRCFCITDSGSLGLGSGAMARGDVVVVPYGCSTPVLLRPEGSSSEDGSEKRTQEYRFVGDVYIHGYMDGEAMDQRQKEEFVLH